MNRDDIIRMAREAGVLSGYESDLFVRFAALVAAAVAANCGECGKSAAEGWALYCVQCYDGSMVKAAVAEEREKLLSSAEWCRVCEQRRFAHENTTSDATD